MISCQRVMCIIAIPLLLASCAQIETSNGEPQWDFDHQVQFRQTKLSDNSYHLAVVPKSKTPFSRLATFLLRRSKDICLNYGYKIEILQGVQGFNDRQGSPNYIWGSLEANIECVSSEKKK
ncbi:hypothetical protein [Thalassotalea sp. PLHSN55]|uniref:hypothetical protein n=1 Tax=Thalassotalea sp. PLHSN55 TaxID=3435888 RepID=UPI003F8493C8